MQRSRTTLLCLNQGTPISCKMTPVCAPHTTTTQQGLNASLEGGFKTKKYLPYSWYLQASSRCTTGPRNPFLFGRLNVAPMSPMSSRTTEDQQAYLLGKEESRGKHQLPGEWGIRLLSFTQNLPKTKEHLTFSMQKKGVTKWGDFRTDWSSALITTVYLHSI